MRPLRTPLLLGALGLTAWTGTAAAHADAGSATGALGQTLTVSKTSGLKAGGETVTRPRTGGTSPCATGPAARSASP